MRVSKAAVLAVLAIGGLAGCDAATEMAKDQIRTQMVQQCEQLAENTGIASENISAACDCSANAIAEDASDGEVQIDQAKLEEILNTCVQEQAPDQAAPAEVENG